MPNRKKQRQDANAFFWQPVFNTNPRRGFLSGIQKVDDGWLILNGAKYEAMMRQIAEQARKARWARENRAREKALRASDVVMGDSGNKREIGYADIRDLAENGKMIQP